MCSFTDVCIEYTQYIYQPIPRLFPGRGLMFFFPRDIAGRQEGDPVTEGGAA